MVERKIINYLGYRYINQEKEETLSMENGMYQQIVRYNSNNHYFDTEISLIPFQFTFSKTGISLESNVGFGVTWRTENPDETNLSNEIMQQLNETSVFPYFPKIGLKIGYIIR